MKSKKVGSKLIENRSQGSLLCQKANHVEGNQRSVFLSMKENKPRYAIIFMKESLCMAENAILNLQWGEVSYKIALKL